MSLILARYLVNCVMPRKGTSGIRSEPIFDEWHREGNHQRGNGQALPQKNVRSAVHK